MVVTKQQKFDSIDIMRGIAILLVILVHTSQRIEGNMFLRSFAQYGQMGVQMFFIASAFTLCYSFESRQSSEKSLRNFYLRRYFRIAPGYYFGIILYYLVTSIFTVVWVSDKNLINILANALFLNGLYQPANNNVVPGGWSIGTEMLFYLIFPFIFSSYIKLQNRYKFTYLVIPFFALFLSLIIQFIFYSLTKNPGLFINNGFIYFSILNQFPVFCVGISLYFAYKKGLLNNIKFGTCLIMIIFFSCLASYLMRQNTFTLVHAVTPFIAALSFVFIFVLLQNFAKGKGKLLAKIGVVSYSCYLSHFIFTFYFVSYMAKKLNFIYPDIILIVLYLFTVLLTYYSAGLMYKYIELNGVKLGKNIITSRSQHSQITISNNQSGKR
ncbi:acyltransferase [Paenibacillus sp. WQ 127069]|uniref:Acyltransferase n=1 Tax=Paenibacillus baimaensis TaxID=2982185 RepID=A0ABT2UFR1_9BACL|nr:acyltransferase [Paenibacillus sp. WQ 127069]MCU6793447.1 acyltransferase [Paenibacillus sp. WQ 127069]